MAGNRGPPPLVAEEMEPAVGLLLLLFSSFRIALESLSEEPSLKSGKSGGPPLRWSDAERVGGVGLCSVATLLSESEGICSSLTDTFGSV